MSSDTFKHTGKPSFGKLKGRDDFCTPSIRALPDVACLISRCGQHKDRLHAQEEESTGKVELATKAAALIPVAEEVFEKAAELMEGHSYIELL